MAEFKIRRATAGDIDCIARFNSAMALETEHLELEADRVRAGVAGLFADAGRGFYLLAESGETVAGQLMITYEWSDWRNGTFWWIQSVYVDPAFRGQGAFRQLYRYVEQLAREDGGVCGMRLYVEKENARAQRVYQSHGMQATAYAMYEVDFVLRRGHG